jgi:ABC-type sugar transport system substrate-binding protein
MRKLISLLLALILLTALLAACGDKTPPPETSPAAVSPSATPGTDGPGTDAATPAGEASKAGYIDDPVDHYDRDTYQIAYLAPAFMFLQQSWFAGMQEFEERLNIKVTSFSGEGDNDLYLQTIEIIADQGFDGIIIDCEVSVANRAYELLEESKLPYIAFVQSLIDGDNQTVCPQVVLDQYQTGEKVINWLVDNYRSYWGEIDTSKLGLIDVCMSTQPDLATRAIAPEKIFKETFPDGTFFSADTATAGGVTPDAAYSLVSAIASSNPQIERWWVTGSTEFFGVGAARALEELGKTDTSLICVVGAGQVVVDWDSMAEDTKSPLVACLAISDLLYAAPAVSGIVALIDGRATKEDLWLDKTPAGWQFGEKYGVWLVENDVVTRETYKTYFDEINIKYLESGGH